MKPYFFLMHGKPAPESSEYANVSHGNIHIWVMAPDADAAEKIALSYVTGYHWIPEETEYALEIQPEQIPTLHEAEARLYRQALEFGVAADFVGVKKGDPEGPNVVEMRRLKP